MSFLFMHSEYCFSTFGRLDWVGWRLVRGEDGRGWPTSQSATGDPLFLTQKECHSSPFDHQSKLMKDHFMGTITSFEISIFFTFLNNGCVSGYHRSCVLPIVLGLLHTQRGDAKVLYVRLAGGRLALRQGLHIQPETEGVCVIGDPSGTSIGVHHRLSARGVGVGWAVGGWTIPCPTGRDPPPPTQKNSII